MERKVGRNVERGEGGMIGGSRKNGRRMGGGGRNGGKRRGVRERGGGK